MKSLLLSLLALLLVSVSAVAGPRHPRQPRQSGRHIWGVADTDRATPTSIRPELTAQASQISDYYTDVLRLSHAQTIGAKRATLRYLLELDQDLTESGQAVRFDLAMRHLLRPGQYSTFRRLTNREPQEDTITLATR